MKIIIVAHDSSFCFYNFHPFVSCFTVPTIDHSLLIHTPTSVENESKNSGFIKILLPYTHTHTCARFPCTWLTLTFPYATPTKRHISPTANDPLPQFVVVGTRGSYHDITRTALLQAAWYVVVRGFPCSAHISHIKSSSITLNFVASNIHPNSTDPPPFHPTSSPSSGNGR